ncbi:MAG: nucleotidyltransferase domain-containing protein [Elusimicrobiota bacterium]|jgi:hypothetical protein
MMKSFFTVLAAVGFCASPALSFTAPVNYAELPIFHSQIPGSGAILAAPGNSLIEQTLAPALTPSLDLPMNSIESVHAASPFTTRTGRAEQTHESESQRQSDLPLIADMRAPQAESEQRSDSALPADMRVPQAEPIKTAMPALETLARDVQKKEDGSDAAAIDNFYDYSVLRSAPEAAESFAPLTRDPVTKLYGVNPEQLKEIVSILKKHYGNDLMDLAAIGSRAKGKASSLKNYRPPTPRSDLDLAPLLCAGGGNGPDIFAVAKEIEAAVGFPIELHGVLSPPGAKFGEYVTFYGGGDIPTWEFFNNGDAVRIPLD